MTTIKLIEPAHEYKMYKGKKEILTITKTVTKILSEVRLIDLSKVPAGVLERANPAPTDTKINIDKINFCFKNILFSFCNLGSRVQWFTVQGLRKTKAVHLKPATLSSEFL